MAILYIQGLVDVAKYRAFCQENKTSAEKAVFIFPGNTGHHGKNHNLFSIKSGGGLAIPAGQLGALGLPVLSLPTTEMNKWTLNLEIQKLANDAIADLWRAIGAGYDLVLPVRTHKSSTYFSNALEGTDNQEPSFWGGIDKTPNTDLADFYTEHLDYIYRFMQVKGSAQEAEFLIKMRNNE